MAKLWFDATAQMWAPKPIYYCADVGPKPNLPLRRCGRPSPIYNCADVGPQAPFTTAQMWASKPHLQPRRCGRLSPIYNCADVGVQAPSTTAQMLESKPHLPDEIEIGGKLDNISTATNYVIVTENFRLTAY